jgi:hypothetical protein
VDSDTCELSESHLDPQKGQARRFYQTLPGPLRVGTEGAVNNKSSDSEKSTA